MEWNWVWVRDVRLLGSLSWFSSTLGLGTKFWDVRSLMLKFGELFELFESFLGKFCVNKTLQKVSNFIMGWNMEKSVILKGQKSTFKKNSAAAEFKKNPLNSKCLTFGDVQVYLVWP